MVSEIVFVTGVAIGIICVLLFLGAVLIPRRAAASKLPQGTPQQREDPPPLPYARIPHLLTPAERSFFEVLRAATPMGLAIFPQVRLANLVAVTSKGKQRTYDFYRIQAKCVDFVLCDSASTAPRLVVELDDSSHDRRDRRNRDAFVDAALGSAGIPVLHVRWQRQYDSLALAAQINAALSGTPAPEAAALYAPPRGDDGNQRAPLPPARQRPRQIGDGPLPGPGVQEPAAHRLPVVVSTTKPEVVVAPVRPTTYACGQCQGEIAASARVCPHCGSNLAHA